mmetsp:Transcript_96303/g.272275  ORF Transcript_96303/g.272275 Transcript_96303/m.272275 type:complete len:253 (+) Transcript_96303:620-1378(+)
MQVHLAAGLLVGGHQTHKLLLSGVSVVLDSPLVSLQLLDCHDRVLELDDVLRLNVPELAHVGLDTLKLEAQLVEKLAVAPARVLVASIGDVHCLNLLLEPLQVLGDPLQAAIHLLVASLHRVDPPADAVLVVEGGLDAVKQADGFVQLEALLLSIVGGSVQLHLKILHKRVHVLEHHQGLLGLAPMDLHELLEVPLRRLRELRRTLERASRGPVARREVLVRVPQIEEVLPLLLETPLRSDHAVLQRAQAGV